MVTPSEETSSNSTIHLAKTLVLLGLVAVSLLVPVIASLVYYDAEFGDAIDNMPGAFVLLAVAGALVGIVVEFTNVWLTRRSEFGAILGTSTAILVAAYVAVPWQGSPIAFISLGCAAFLLLLFTIPWGPIAPNRRPTLDTASEPVANPGQSKSNRD